MLSSMHGVRRVNCAIYTRKSTEEGLEQDFNSLDAQRASCAAYIESQKIEGWVLSEPSYDDGGFSGGSLKRPALQRLLDDVVAGKVDVIVVYKIDRLTRSLSDFARIVEVLDSAKASFVSVTQAFNTTSSMGRLTLNVLLSFAQFERGVTGERIRDKFAASRARGMWMGGVVPLGYDLIDRKLKVNPAEAKVVRHIYRRYCELDSMLALREELEASGIRSKVRISAAGNRLGGAILSCGAIYFILQNRTYVGEVSYKGSVYAGEHSALMEPVLFSAVQEKLAARRRSRRESSARPCENLLTGIVWDEHGRRLTPTYTSKGIKRYRYYSSPQACRNDQARTRVTAADLESIVVQRLQSFLSDEAAIHDAIHPFANNAQSLSKALGVASAAVQELASTAPHAVRTQLLHLIERIEVHGQSIGLHLSRSVFLPDGLRAPALILDCPTMFEQRAKDLRLVLAPPAGAPTEPRRDRALIKLMVQAYAARAAIERGSGTLEELAGSQGFGCRHFRVLLRISYLSPRILSAILEGRQPPSLTRDRLARMSDLPSNWSEQEVALGFRFNN